MTIETKGNVRPLEEEEEELKKITPVAYERGFNAGLKSETGQNMSVANRREIQNKERYNAAQERGDNYAIKYYEFRMRLDKLDAEKAKVRKEIQALKKKFGKFKK